VSIPSLTRRVFRHWRQHGTGRTIRFLSSRIYRRSLYIVFEAQPDGDVACPHWHGQERLIVIGRNNIDSHLTPSLRTFLGGEEAIENLNAVRQGDWLFVVADGDQYLHCGYVFFRTPQTKLLGEDDNPPLIACCYTPPEFRGRGLYRKALRAELCQLWRSGYKRIVIETHPDNVSSRKGIEAAGFHLRREVTDWIFLNRIVLQRRVEASGSGWISFIL
jgi:RimJ/RimL family protein N-acetyltransferase